MKDNLYKKLEEDYYEKNKEEIKKILPDIKKKNLLKEDLRTLGIKFGNIHIYSNELATKYKKDFAGKKTFSGRSIKFILNTLKNKIDNVEEGIISVIQDIYCYPYKKSQSELKEKLVDIFMEKPNNELMQFLRNDEVDVEEKYKQINQYLKNIENNPNFSFDMSQFLVTSFSYIYKDIPKFIEKIEECMSSLDIENINYTYISILRRLLQNYLDRKGNDEEIKKGLKKKKINDLDLSKEDESLRVPQNLLFIYQGLLNKKLIEKISYIDYSKYYNIINNKENEDNEEIDNDILIKLDNIQNQYIKRKNLNGENPFLELCLNESNIVGSLTSLTLAYPELNDYSKEELEDILKNLTEFNRQLFIIFIKLFNNSEYNEMREEIILCEELNKLINTQDFIQIIEDNYSKENLLKNTNFEEDEIILREFKRIEKQLKNLSEITFE